MTIPIRKNIEELTPTAVAREMGLPISTIFRWMTEDRIPGKGAAHAWRVREFETAIARLRESSGSKPSPTTKEPPARPTRRARGPGFRKAA